MMMRTKLIALFVLFFYALAIVPSIAHAEEIKLPPTPTPAVDEVDPGEAIRVSA